MFVLIDQTLNEVENKYGDNGGFDRFYVKFNVLFCKAWEEDFKYLHIYR